MSTDRQFLARSGVAICSALSTALLLNEDDAIADPTPNLSPNHTLDTSEFNTIIAAISDSFIDFSFALQAKNYSQAHQYWHDIRNAVENGQYVLRHQFIKNLWEPMQNALETSDEQRIHIEYRTLVSSYNRAYH